MITVHHLNQSRSQRVLWLLEELELPYELVTYERDPKTMFAPEALRKVHPLGKSPVITDDDLVIAESGAILEHLALTHGGGKLVPPVGTAAHRDCRYFMHYAEGSLMPFLVMALVFGKVRRAPVPFFVKPIVRKIADTVTGQFVTPNVSRHLLFLEGYLASHAWFGGDELSIADIQMSYPCEAIVARAQGVVPTPRIIELVARMKARPAYQRALAKGGPVLID